MKKIISLISTILLCLTSLDANASKTIHDLKKELKTHTEDKKSMCRLSDFLVEISESKDYNFVKAHMSAVSSLKAIYLCEGNIRDNKGQVIDPEYRDDAYQRYCTNGDIYDKKTLLTFEDSINSSLIVSRGFDNMYITYLLHHQGFALVSKSKPKIPPSSLSYYLKIDGCVAKRFKPDESPQGLYHENIPPKFLRSKK